MAREIKRVPVDYVDDGETTDPPSGDGWQVWEDVSEGSPLSPIYAHRTEVVNWLVRNEDCAPAAAEAFVDAGWAPSFLVTGFGMFTGVQVAAGPAAHIEWLHRQAGDDTTLAPDTSVRHKASGVTGCLLSQLAPPRGDYYAVEWSRGLPELLEGEAPDKPMQTATRRDGFELVEDAIR